MGRCFVGHARAYGTIVLPVLLALVGCGQGDRADKGGKGDTDRGWPGPDRTERVSAQDDDRSRRPEASDMSANSAVDSPSDRRGGSEFTRDQDPGVGELPRPQEAVDGGMDEDTADPAPNPKDAGEASPQVTVDRCGAEADAATVDQGFVVDVDTLAFLFPTGALFSPVAWPSELTPDRHPWMQWPDCLGACKVNPESYRQSFFGRSDTTVVVLRGTPYTLGPDGTQASGYAPVHYEDLVAIQSEVGEQAPNIAPLLAPVIMPNDRLEVQLAMMEQRAGKASAWATYTAWSPSGDGGYWLDDATGSAFIDKGVELGVPVFLIFKGMPWHGLSRGFTDPRDIGPAATRHPDAHLVVMQGAFEHGLDNSETSAPVDAATDLGWGPGVGQWPEGPYDETDSAVQALFPLDRGVNSLIKSLRDANVGPNGHVYVALGGVWAELITRPTEAAHVLGKLLRHVGEDNVLWGTQAMMFGIPAPQIEAFRNFQIPEPMRAQHGYPELTPLRKAKILGLNAARLFCLEQSSR